MALEFPKEWRFDEGLGRMPQEALPDLVGLIEKVATQAKSAKGPGRVVARHRGPRRGPWTRLAPTR